MLVSLLWGKKGREGRGRTLSWETPAEALQDGLGLCPSHGASEAHGAGAAHGAGEAHGINMAHGISKAHSEAHGIDVAHGAEPPQGSSPGGQGIAASFLPSERPARLRQAWCTCSQLRLQHALPPSRQGAPTSQMHEKDKDGGGGEAAFCVGVLVG